jgi:hypothetical protein
MMLQVNNLLYRPEVVRSCFLSRLPKNAFNYFVLSLPVIIVTTTTIIMIDYIIIINNDERLQDPILLLKIPKGMKKNFSENYRQFGHVLSQKGSPALGRGVG